MLPAALVVMRTQNARSRYAERLTGLFGPRAVLPTCQEQAAAARREAELHAPMVPRRGDKGYSAAPSKV